MVPISTEIGISSYRCPGTSSSADKATLPMARPRAPAPFNSSTKSMKKNSDRNAIATNSTEPAMSR
jgi:hypothetical protein